MNDYPSTTSILETFGFYRYLDRTRYADSEVGKHRGSAVDKAVTWLAVGKEPPWLEPHPELDGYLDGFRKFLREHSWVHESHQDEFVNHEERYLSHPDLLGALDGRRGVLEIKTGAFPDFVRLQTAGQVLAEASHRRKMEDLAVPFRARFCIDLPGDGKYKLLPLSDPGDLNAFITFARAYWVRRSYGL